MKRILLFLVILANCGLALSQSAPAGSGQPFVVEYYYKAEWGHADEFLKFFKKNHYPLLKKEVEMGRMLKVWVDQTALSHHRRRPLGLSRHHRLQECNDANEPFDEERLKSNCSRPGNLRSRRAATLRDSGGTLGFPCDIDLERMEALTQRQDRCS